MNGMGGGGTDVIGGGGVGAALRPVCDKDRAHEVQNWASSRFWLPQPGQNITHLSMKAAQAYHRRMKVKKSRSL